MVTKRYKIVKIDWIDASLDSSQDATLEEALKIEPVRRTNTGYLLERTKDRVVLCFGKDQHNRFSDILIVPGSWSTKIKELKE